MNGSQIRKPKPHLRRDDPVQAALRSALHGLSDSEIADIEADLWAFRRYGTASDTLQRLMALSRRMIETSGGSGRAAA